MRTLQMSVNIEDKLNAVIVSLHPHKALIRDLRVRSYILRRGWGHIKALFQVADTNTEPINILHICPACKQDLVRNPVEPTGWYCRTSDCLKNTHCRICGASHSICCC